MKSICGIDCTNCELCNTCNGCAATEGQPFGAECLVAQCCKKGKTSLSELNDHRLKPVGYRGLKTAV